MLTRMMHLTNAVQENAARYCTIIACLFPITALLSYMNNLLICHGHSAKSMMSGMLSNALNAIFSYIVLYRIHLPIDGVSAVAICAGLAQLVGLGVSVTAFYCSGCFVKWRLARKTIRDILRMGVPAGMSLLSYNLSQTITTSFITAMGVAVINTKLYVANVVGYTSRISVSLGNAGGILMGRHRGGHRIDSVRKLYWQNILLAVICNASISLAVLLLRKPIFSIFTKDSEILAAVASILIIDVFLEIPRGINHVSEYALNANGDVRIPLVTSIISG